MDDIINWAFKRDKDTYETFLLDCYEQVKKGIQKKNGYERSNYFFYDDSGSVTSDVDVLDISSDNLYNEANYYSARIVAENNSRADSLMRKLRRFSVEHPETDVNDGIFDQTNYYIYYDYNDGMLKTSFYYSFRKIFGTIYFGSKHTAQKAIDEFNDDLIWYFTEYQDRL